MKYVDFFEMIDDIGMSVEQYSSMLEECHNMSEGIIPKNWDYIVEKYNLPWKPDSVRRAFTSPFLGGSAVYSYFKNIGTYPSSESLEIYEIRKEKQKLQDVRKAINKGLRDRARLEEDLKYLEQCIKNKNVFPKYEIAKSSNSHKTMVICLSDIHFGLDVECGFGMYNEDVVNIYLDRYYKKICDIKNLYSIDECYLLLLGDLISGNIHYTVQLQNREDIISQSQKISEILSSFTYELGKVFNTVYVNGVAGNHSRIGFKDDVLRGERLDNIIPWYMKASLSHIDNIIFVDSNNYDDTIAQFEIHNQKFWAVHGDFDKLDENGISKLVMMLGYKPDGLFMGHFHKCEYTEVAGIPLIRSGSFCGTVDDFTIKKRISGIPSQMIAVISEDGVECCYPVNLEK